MGWGDEIIGSGLARGAAVRGKRIAFGDGRRILWSPQAHEIFRDNPNVARPGEERQAGLEWIEHYVGHRLYAKRRGRQWLFRDFTCLPGEIFFRAAEKIFALKAAPTDLFAVIEPRVKSMGACVGANKQWPLAHYGRLVHALPGATGLIPVQFVPRGSRPLLRDVRVIETPSFRHALAVLALASLYIGPEGGLHHGAAAVGTPAVVIFGGFNTPRSTGYAFHENIAVGDPCGQQASCSHCRQIMASISPERVLEGALRQIQGAAAREIA